MSSCSCEPRAGSRLWDGGFPSLLCTAQDLVPGIMQYSTVALYSCSAGGSLATRTKMQDHRVVQLKRKGNGFECKESGKMEGMAQVV